eukprot:gb/GECG01000825.1/.p1 GENE.gb/GECG01000825.1/~~gb/GECG01000825.1/.p1  ORF type:complete len:187 (+),score=6.01 gb/GECG01000825.1/:1-561(+)
MELLAHVVVCELARIHIAGLGSEIPVTDATRRDSGVFFLWIADDDTIICLMSSQQKKFFKENMKRGILFDATHHTSRYDVMLLTVHCVDHARRGVPVFTAVIPSESSRCIELCLRAITAVCGDSNVEVVITDDGSGHAEAIQNAWPTVHTHLLCHWHLLRTFRRNITAKRGVSTPDELRIIGDNTM